MRKGLERWVSALVAIMLAIALILAMYFIGTGAITQVARSLFGQS